jgi:hypothetical protein
MKQIITHVDFPNWEMDEFCYREMHPRSSTQVRYNGVVVGHRHDHDRGRAEHVTSVSDSPAALAKVQAFFDAVNKAEKERRELSLAMSNIDREMSDALAARAAEIALGVTQ